MKKIIGIGNALVDVLAKLQDDELLEVKLTDGNSKVLIAVKSGKLVRFDEAKTRPMGRTASGVRGITLAHDKDEVIGMVAVNDMSSEILVVSENGYGKRSSLDEYRETNRGGKGVKTMNITDKTGLLVSLNSVTDNDDLMIINKSGLTIRMRVSDLRVMGRATQGVRLINIKGNDSIAAVAKVMREDEEEIDSDVVVLVEGEEGDVSIVSENLNDEEELNDEEQNSEE